MPQGQYVDGGKFWKGKMPPSSTGSQRIDYRSNTGGSGVRKYVGGKPTNDVRGAEDDFPKVNKPMMPRGQMPMKTTGIARAKEVASSQARGLFNKAAKVKDVISRIGARRKAKEGKKMVGSGFSRLPTRLKLQGKRAK